MKTVNQNIAQDHKAMIDQAIQQASGTYRGIMTSDKREEAEHFLYYHLHAKLNKSIKIPYNVLIRAADLKEAEDFGRFLLSALENLEGHECTAFGSEQEIINILDNKDKKILSNCHALGIGNFGSEYKDWNGRIRTLQQQTEISVIACTSYELSDKNIYPDEDLFFSVLTNHISIYECSEEDILHAHIQQLEKIGYTCSDLYCQEMRKYIQVVYPSARLREVDFLEDLKVRVINQHEKQADAGEVIGPESIPYSKKYLALQQSEQEEKTEISAGNGSVEAIEKAEGTAEEKAENLTEGGEAEVEAKTEDITEEKAEECTFYKTENFESEEKIEEKTEETAHTDVNELKVTEMENQKKKDGKEEKRKKKSGKQFRKKSCR